MCRETLYDLMEPKQLYSKKQLEELTGFNKYAVGQYLQTLKRHGLIEVYRNSRCWWWYRKDSPPPAYKFDMVNTRKAMPRGIYA